MCEIKKRNVLNLEILRALERAIKYEYGLLMHFQTLINESHPSVSHVTASEN